MPLFNNANIEMDILWNLHKFLFFCIVGINSVCTYGSSLTLSVIAEIDEADFPKYYSVAGELGGPLSEGNVSFGAENYLNTSKNIRFTVLEHSPDGSSSKLLDSFDIKVRRTSASYIKEVTDGSEPIVEIIKDADMLVDAYVDNNKIGKDTYTTIERLGQTYNSFSVRSNSPFPRPFIKPENNLVKTSIEINVSVIVSPVII